MLVPGAELKLTDLSESKSKSFNDGEAAIAMSPAEAETAARTQLTAGRKGKVAPVESEEVQACEHEHGQRLDHRRQQSHPRYPLEPTTSHQPLAEERHQQQPAIGSGLGRPFNSCSRISSRTSRFGRSLWFGHGTATHRVAVWVRGRRDRLRLCLLALLEILRLRLRRRLALGNGRSWCEGTQGLGRC